MAQAILSRETHTEQLTSEVVATKPEHVKCLDGVRGLAILLVAAHHWVHYLQIVPHANYPAGMQVLMRIANFGYCGVTLFFVLSGFLITRILLSTKSKSNYLASFYARRALRIFPLYYATLFILTIITWFAARMGPVQDQICLWLYSTNLSLFHHDKWIYGPLDHLWSLSIEEQFYFIFPVLVKILSLKNIRLLCFTLFFSAIATRFMLLTFGFHHCAVYCFPISHVDALASGALLATFEYSHELKPPSSVQKFFVLAMFGSCAVTVLALNLPFDSQPIELLGSTVYSVFFAGCILNLLTSPKRGTLKGILSSKVMMKLGKYSYGIYIYHYIVFLVVSRALKIQFTPMMAVLYVLVTAAITFLLAYGSYELFERKFLTLKKYC